MARKPKRNHRAYNSLRGRRLKGKGKGVLAKRVLGARETREGGGGGGARREGGKRLPGNHCFSRY